MDHGQNPITTNASEDAGRAQQMSLIYAVMVCLAMLILLQTLMLNIAVEGYLGGTGKVVVPATACSGLCFAGSLWLTAYIRRMGRSA